MVTMSVPSPVERGRGVDKSLAVAKGFCGWDSRGLVLRGDGRLLSLALRERGSCANAPATFSRFNPTTSLIWSAVCQPPALSDRLRGPPSSTWNAHEAAGSLTRPEKLRREYWSPPAARRRGAIWRCMSGSSCSQAARAHPAAKGAAPCPRCAGRAISHSQSASMSRPRPRRSGSARSRRSSLRPGEATTREGPWPSRSPVPPSCPAGPRQSGFRGRR